MPQITAMNKGDINIPTAVTIPSPHAIAGNIIGNTERRPIHIAHDSNRPHSNLPAISEAKCRIHFIPFP